MPTTDQRSTAATFVSLLSHVDELISAGRVREARLMLTQFIERKQIDPRMLPALAGLYLRVGKPDLAIRTMCRAIELSGPSPELFNTLGLIYATLGRERESREQFEAALTVDPANSDALRNLAFVLHRSGERARAYGLLVRCYRAAPLSVDLRLICGTLLELDGLLDDAANCYRDAIELSSVSEQVEMASQRLFAVGSDRPAMRFEQVIGKLESEYGRG